jgi:hypothetical protein
LPGGFDIGDLPVGYQTETRQVAIMVEHQMQLDRALGAAKLCPHFVKFSDAAITPGYVTLMEKI